jgi:hypothetical protein
MAARLRVGLIFPGEEHDYSWRKLGLVLDARTPDRGGLMRFLFGAHVLDTARRELTRGGEQIALEPQVFDLLVYLLRNRERVVSKDDLLASVWGGRIVSDATLDSRISAAERGHIRATLNLLRRRSSLLKRPREINPESARRANSWLPRSTRTTSNSPTLAEALPVQSAFTVYAAITIRCWITPLIL